MANPYDDELTVQRGRKVVERRGERLEEAPRSIAPGASRYVPERDWWRTAGGMVKVLAAAAASLGVATGSLVAIIGALRQPTDPKLREDVEGTRKEVAALRAYLGDKDTARARELEQRFDAVAAKLVELDVRYPAPKPDPLRPPK